MNEEEQKEPVDSNYQRAKSRSHIKPGEWITGIIFCSIPFLGLLLFLAFASGTRERRNAGLFRVVCGTLAIVSLVAFFALQYLHPCKVKSNDPETKANTYTVKIALDRYATDHDGQYPESIDTIIEQNPYVMPYNFYTIKETRIIEFGDQPWDDEMTYLPVREGDQIKKYFLLSYGRKDYPGIDVNGDGVGDHVLIVLTSGTDKDVSELEPYKDELKNLLNGTKPTS
jgi:hypothetical protein